MKAKRNPKKTSQQNAKRKAKLKLLIEEKAVREYFLDKMHRRLAQGVNAKQTRSRMFRETKKRYQLFDHKVMLIEDEILKLVTPGTHYNELRFFKKPLNVLPTYS
jgi:hypothetical protein